MCSDSVVFYWPSDFVKGKDGEPGPVAQVVSYLLQWEDLNPRSATGMFPTIMIWDDSFPVGSSRGNANASPYLGFSFKGF